MKNDIKNKSEYISLKEATKYCDYSQEYLSLRARQGKLKAVKIGRNWVTKKEWIEQYLNSPNSYYRKEEELAAELKREGDSSIKYNEEKKAVLGFKFLGLAVILLSLSLSLFFLKIERGVSFQKIKEDYSPKEIIVVFNSRDVQASVIDTFREYGSWLKEKSESLTTIGRKKLLVFGEYIKRIPELVLSGIKKPKEVAEKNPKTSVEEGIVITPLLAEEEKTKNRIKKAFSYKVKIEPKDETSGIIVPVFKTEEEQKYLYIMVPVEEKNN